MPRHGRLELIARHLYTCTAATTPLVASATAPTESDCDAPLTNIQPLSAYERFLFDLKGYLVIPNVLSVEELAAVRAHVHKYSTRAWSLPQHHRAPMAGPAEFLISHPRVLGIVTEFIDPDPTRVRIESVFVSQREAGVPYGWKPHGGGVDVNPSFSYKVHNNRIYAGMTRIVWELNEVVRGKGGTCLIPGSHKVSDQQTHTWKK